MALRIASVARINGAGCDHLSLVLEEGPMGGPADRSLTVHVDEDDIEVRDDIEKLAVLVAALPGKAKLKGAYLFAWALYQRQVKGTPINQVVGTWID